MEPKAGLPDGRRDLLDLVPTSTVTTGKHAAGGMGSAEPSNAVHKAFQWGLRCSEGEGEDAVGAETSFQLDEDAEMQPADVLAETQNATNSVSPQTDPSDRRNNRCAARPSCARTPRPASVTRFACPLTTPAPLPDLESATITTPHGLARASAGLRARPSRRGRRGCGTSSL